MNTATNLEPVTGNPAPLPNRATTPDEARIKQLQARDRAWADLVRQSSWPDASLCIASDVGMPGNGEAVAQPTRFNDLTQGESHA